MYHEVEDILKHTKIPKTRRAKISDSSVRTVTLGVVNRPFSSFKGYSKFTEQNPALWNAIKRLAENIDPDHRYSSVTINHNVTCKPHKDIRNDGTTMIVALGDYEGGKLVVDGKEIDIKHKPYYFNGYLHEHYNLPFTGNRWSLMFYSCKKTWDIVHRDEDIPVIREVYHGNQYQNGKLGFGIEKGDQWIDIGGHIGCFAKKCTYYGAEVVSYEPDKDNFEILRQNTRNAVHSAVGVHNGMVDIVKGSKNYFNKTKSGATVPIVGFNEIVKEGCCVKMDIEGQELEILDQCDFTGIKKMVFAYHITADRSRTNFLRRMDRLREWFTVHHQKIKEEHMNFFPNEIIVYCIGG